MVAASASELLDPGARRSLQKLVDISGESVRGRVIVVNRRGRLLADSADSAPGRSYADRPEVAAALEGHGEQITRYSKTLGAEILATSAPVLSHGRPDGAVRITQSVAAVHAAVKTSILDLAALAGLVLLLGLGAGAVVAQRIARPIRRLDRAARRVATGELDQAVEVEGSAEQRSLALAFNEMTARIGRLLRAPAGLRRRCLTSAAHAAHGVAAAARGARRTLRPRGRRGERARGGARGDRPALADRRRAADTQPGRGARAAGRASRPARCRPPGGGAVAANGARALDRPRRRRRIRLASRLVRGARPRSSDRRAGRERIALLAGRLDGDHRGGRGTASRSSIGARASSPERRPLSSSASGAAAPAAGSRAARASACRSPAS